MGSDFYSFLIVDNLDKFVKKKNMSCLFFLVILDMTHYKYKYCNFFLKRNINFLCAIIIYLPSKKNSAVEMKSALYIF